MILCPFSLHFHNLLNNVSNTASSAFFCRNVVRNRFYLFGSIGGAYSETNFCHNFVVGYVVDHVSDGEQGLDYALAGEYDAAIVDIMMPKLDGAHSLIDLQKADRIPRVFSYREAKRA